MIDWTATREVRVMPKKRYTPKEIIQHLQKVVLDTSKGLAVLDSCRKQVRWRDRGEMKQNESVD